MKQTVVLLILLVASAFSVPAKKTGGSPPPATPTLIISPAVLSSGAEINYSGSSFGSNTGVTIDIEGPCFQTIYTVTDHKGSFDVHFAMPYPVGYYNATAYQSEGGAIVPVAEAGFQVE